MDVLPAANEVNNLNDTKTAGRTPKCTRCRNHGITSDLRGHKYKCYWRSCACPKCLISCHKQRETADRIALFRQQVREAKEMDKLERSGDANDIKRVEELKKLMATKIGTLPQGKISPSSSTMDIPIEYNPDGRVSSELDKWKENVKFESTEDKNLAILKYLFPFYDINILKVLSQSCRNDVLETVLSISARIMEERQYMTSSSTGLKPHFPKALSENNFERCCESPLCPVNSYLELRMKGSLTQPSVSPYPMNAKRYASSIDSPLPFSKKRFEPYPNEEKCNVPFCASCNRYGLQGDKFCPLCGVQY